MNRRFALGLSLLALWTAWGFALQGLAASSPTLGPWTPDLGVVVLLALEPRLFDTRALLVVLVVSATRVAFTVDPPLAIFVGYSFLHLLSGRLRRVIEIDRPLPRACLAGLVSLALGAYWSVARSAVLASAGLTVSRAEFVAPRLGLALATAMACLALSPLVQRLPGISLIVRSRR